MFLASIKDVLSRRPKGDRPAVTARRGAVYSSASVGASTPARNLPPQVVVARSYDGPVEPEEPWGAWFHVAVPARVAVQVTWSNDPAPLVYAFDEHGAKHFEPLLPAGAGEPIWMELPAGKSYVAVQAQGVDAQFIQAMIWLPTTVAGRPRAA